MSATIVGHDGESIASSLFILVFTLHGCFWLHHFIVPNIITNNSLFILLFTLLCWYRLQRSMWNYMFPDIIMNDSLLTPTPPSVTVTVARFPANGRAPSLIRLTTTTKSLVQGPDVFPSHVPDVWTLWGLPETMSIYRDWETTQLKNQPVEACNGMYMTVYSFAPQLRENHHVPEILRPRSRMNGDVVVARLGERHGGRHGRAVYEDVNPQFLKLPCVIGGRESSR